MHPFENTDKRKICERHNFISHIHEQIFSLEFYTNMSSSMTLLDTRKKQNERIYQNTYCCHIHTSIIFIKYSTHFSHSAVLVSRWKMMRCNIIRSDSCVRRKFRKECSENYFEVHRMIFKWRQLLKLWGNVYFVYPGWNCIILLIEYHILEVLCMCASLLFTSTRIQRLN